MPVGKKASESQIELTHLVLPSDANTRGTIFGGRIMAWIDMAAAIVASRHARKNAVTVSMDELHFISPTKVGDIVILKASVNYTHRTSMEIGVKVESENPLTGERRHTASAYLTFVCLDEKGSPSPVLSVIPDSEIQKGRFREAEKRREHRLKTRETEKKNRGAGCLSRQN